MKRSVQLAVAFFVLSTLPVAFVTYVTTVSAEKTIRQGVESHLFAITEMRAADFDRWVRSVEGMIESIAQRPLVVDLTAALVAQAKEEAPADPSVPARLRDMHLRPHLQVEGLFEAFVIVDAESGEALLSTDVAQVGTSQIEEAQYEEGRAATYVGQVMFSPALGRTAMHVATPIGRFGEAASGVLVGRVDLGVIQEIISRSSDAHETEDVYFVSRSGLFATEPRFGEGDALQRPVKSDGVERALAGEAGVARYDDYRGVSVLGSFRWLPDHQMALIAEIDVSEAFAAIHQARVLGLALLGGAIAVFSFFGIALARGMTHPLRRIAASAAKIGRGEFGHRIGSSRVDELGDLARAFDEMAEDLQRITASRDDLDREVVRRREAEERLRETLAALEASEAQFRLLSEASPIGVFILQDMKFRYANPALEEIFGYESSELIDRLGVLDLAQSDGHRGVLDYIRKTLDHPGVKPPLTFTGRKKDGSNIQCEVLARPIEFDGEPALVGTVTELTLRLQVEQTRQMADDIVRMIPAGMFIYQVVSPDRLVLVDANPEAERLTDVRLEAARGLEFEEVWTGVMGAEVKAGCLEAFSSGVPYRTEDLAYADDQTEGHYRIRAFRIPDDRVVVSFEDVGLLKRAEERFRLAAEVASDLIYEWDVETDELLWHGDIDRALGFEPGEVRRTIEGWVSLIHPEDRERLAGAVDRHRTATEPIYEEYRIRRKDGSWRHWIDRGVPVLINLARPRRWIGVCIDETERIVAHGSLAESEARFRRILENAPDVIYRQRVSPTPGFDYISPAIFDVVGYTPEEYYADPLLSLKIVHPDDRQHLEGTLRGKSIDGLPHDTRWVHKDGHVVWTEDRHVSIRDEEGNLVAIEGVARDITDWKEAQAARETADDIVRSIPTGLLILEDRPPDGFFIVTGNPSATQLIAAEGESLSGKRLSEAFPPPMVPRVVAAFREVLESGNVYDAEVAVPDEEGIRFAFHVRAFPIPGRRVVAAFEDTTAQRRAEENLRESEAKYRALVEEIHEVIFTVDRDGIITFVGPAIEQLIGYRPEQLIGQEYRALGLSADLPTPHDMEEAFNRSSGTHVQEYRVTARDGNERWIRATSHPLMKDGCFAGLRGIVIDVTEAKRAEEALRVSEEQHRSLFENAALGIYQTTPDGGILAANPALVRMLGYESFEDLVKRNLEEDGYESETPRVRFKEQIERDGRLEGLESIWTRKDGRRLVVRENAVAVRDEEGNVLFYEGTVEDITAHRAAEEERRSLEAQLRQTQRLESIGTLASGAAHEINNPLTGMINYAELISRRVDDDRLREFAEAIMSEGGRVAKIVRNLLSFSRHDKEAHSPARLVDIVSAAMTLVGALLKKDQIVVAIDVPEDLPSIKCRSQQMQQVFLNLLTNARDALNDRYPKHDDDKVVRIRSMKWEEGGQSWVRTAVEDHGVGVSADVIDRVFDPFFTTKSRDQGTGLGLSVSYGIVRDHGGRLSVESEEGAFTRFTLDLPIDNGWQIANEEGET